MPKDLGLRFVDPADVRVFNIDWTLWLNKLSAVIASSAWSVPFGLNDLNESNTTLITSIKVSGWTLGNSYTLSNTVVTNTGQTRRVEFVVECR